MKWNNKTGMVRLEGGKTLVDDEGVGGRSGGACEVGPWRSRQPTLGKGVEIEQGSGCFQPGEYDFRPLSRRLKASPSAPHNLIFCFNHHSNFQVSSRQVPGGSDLDLDLDIADDTSCEC